MIGSTSLFLKCDKYLRPAVAGFFVPVFYRPTLFLYILLKILFLLILVTSCSYIQKPMQLTDDMTGYAEKLYKRQNQVILQVMEALEEELPLAEDEKLSDAELQMYDNCHLLNEMAVHEMEGDSVSFYFKGQVQRSLKNCNKGVNHLETVLRHVVK